MLKLDRKYFEGLSEKTNFQKDILEKVYRLTDMLKTIYDDEFLTGKLVLKSGLKLDERALKKCFIFYFCLAQDFRKLDLESIGRIDSLEIKKFLLPLMERGKKIDMDEISKKVNEFASRIPALNENEHKFIENFYEQKIADLDLLFEDVKYNPRLKGHPMIGWRLKNM